ncbi:MAG: hypothetical protein Q9227_002485 [Pyrenula ochraceoflavens]
MPAMSPTMTEGNIANWKVKEGDSFSVGDVILEIETDKATMDVEAQDDGIMAKIIQPEGSKSVKVGSRIAVLADEGDDISSLEIPPEDSKPAAKDDKAAKEESQSDKPRPQESKPAPSKPASPPPSGAGQNTKYPLYPSVSALIHEKHIPESDIPKIPASGPQGRLLKGDVLAYLGSIESSYSSNQSARISKLAHLDLSNIKIAAPPEPSTKPSPPDTTASPPPPSEPTTVTLTLPISLTPLLTVQKRISDTLNISVPLSTLLARATDLANDDLLRTKSQRASQADLFNAVLGLDFQNPKTSHGSYIPNIIPLAPSPSSTKPASPTTTSRSRKIKEPDIIEILSGKVSTTSPPSRASPPSAKIGEPGTISAGFAPGAATNLFSLEVPKGEEKRAKTFLERMKTVIQVEPGRLVL